MTIDFGNGMVISGCCRKCSFHSCKGDTGLTGDDGPEGPQGQPGPRGSQGSDFGPAGTGLNFLGVKNSVQGL